MRIIGDGSERTVERRRKGSCYFLFALLLVGGIFFLSHIKEKRMKQNLQMNISQETPNASRDNHVYRTGEHRKSVIVEGKERTFVLHVPKLEEGQNYPLVLLFHGGNGDGEKILYLPHIRALSDSEKFILVAPDGIENGWNDGRGTTEAERTGVDDVEFVRILIAHLAKKLPVDQSRIYATGPSNGGMMSYRLGCELADLFAAIAPVVGGIPKPLEDSCVLGTSIPILAINGLDDPLIPFEGGECCIPGDGGVILSIPQSVAVFAKRNGCEPIPTVEMTPPTVDDGTNVEKRTYVSCAPGHEAVLYIVHGMGHSWPPKDPQSERISGATSKNINATEVIWEFFKEHQK